MQHEHFSNLLRSRSGRSHVTLPVPTRLLQTDIHSFLGILRFCLLGLMSLSFSCHCIRCTNHRRGHSQENESHTLIGSFPRKECMSVWSSRVGTASVTWLRPEWLRRRLVGYELLILLTINKTNWQKHPTFLHYPPAILCRKIWPELAALCSMKKCFWSPKIVTVRLIMRVSTYLKRSNPR